MKAMSKPSLMPKKFGQEVPPGMQNVPMASGNMAGGFKTVIDRRLKEAVENVKNRVQPPKMAQKIAIQPSKDDETADRSDNVAPRDDVSLVFSFLSQEEGPVIYAVM